MILSNYPNFTHSHGAGYREPSQFCSTQDYLRGAHEVWFNRKTAIGVEFSEYFTISLCAPWHQSLRV